MQASSEGFGQLRLRNTLPGGATWSFAIVDNGLSSSSLPTGSLSLGTIEGSGGIGDGPHHSKFVLTPNGEIQASVVVITSDARLKTNITPLTNTLEKLTKVRGVLYDWNDEAKTLGRSTGRREIGVLAQDVEAVFPELVVNWGKDNYKAVDYGKLTGVLIEAVKELRAEKDAQITTLEARLAALEQATGIDSASGHVASSVLPSGWLLVGGLLVGGLVCRSSGHAKHQR
jgi:hypothetical protein